jgi:biuret amidohydrolase
VVFSLVATEVEPFFLVHEGKTPVSDDQKIEEMIRQKEHAPIALQFERTALVVVDVQRFFTRPDDFAQVFHSFSPDALEGYFQRVSSTVLGRILELQNCFRSLGLPVVHCVFGSWTEDGQGLSYWSKDFDKIGLELLDRPVANEASWQIEEAVAPLPGETVINQNASDALGTAHLGEILRGMGINSIVVCGLTTAVCVGLTARQTSERGFRVVIASDACTELSEQTHEAALVSFSHFFGQVRSTQELTRFLTSSRAQAHPPN